MKHIAGLAHLGPVEQLRGGRLPRRIVQLLFGLFLYGLSMALMIRGRLGLSPWDALHIGLADRLPLSFGGVVIVVSFLVLLLWIPLRELPGVGTLGNAVLIGLVADIALGWLRPPHGFAARLAFSSGGVLLCGLATAMYIGAQLGRGPRDGLMTGLHRVTGLSLRLVRTSIELTALLLGLLLGGLDVLGIGTIVFALSIGPMTQALLPFMLIPVRMRGKG